MRHPAGSLLFSREFHLSSGAVRPACTLRPTGVGCDPRRFTTLSTAPLVLATALLLAGPAFAKPKAINARADCLARARSGGDHRGQRARAALRPAHPAADALTKAENAVANAPARPICAPRWAWPICARAASTAALGDAITLGDTQPRTQLSLALAQIGNGRAREALATLDANRATLPPPIWAWRWRWRAKRGAALPFWAMRCAAAILAQAARQPWLCLCAGWPLDRGAQPCRAGYARRQGGRTHDRMGRHRPARCRAPPRGRDAECGDQGRWRHAHGAGAEGWPQRRAGGPACLCRASGRPAARRAGAGRRACCRTAAGGRQHRARRSPCGAARRRTGRAARA
jgi:hypothetical protein